MAAAEEPLAMQSKAPFVLVHGAWHGGWCWRIVAAALRKAGHPVFTPTLTGMGSRLHLGRADTGLNTHIEDVANVLKFEELKGAVLVGHSYGGAVCLGVFDRVGSQISKLIMLDASVLDDGESMTSKSSPEMMAGAKASLIDGFKLPTWPPEAFGVLPEDGWVYDWVKRRLTSMPFGSLTTPLALKNGDVTDPNVLFINCNGRPFGDNSRPGLQKAKARGWTVQDLDTGHDAMVTAPDALANMLLAAL